MEKIQEITEKVFREGVERGNAEAARIVAEAKAQAADIVAQAEAQAADIVAQAKKQAQELDTNTRSELKLYAGQAVSALKSEITTIVSGKITGEAVEALVADKEFLPAFMLKLAENWGSDEPVVIEAQDAPAVKAYFAQKAKALLDKGVTIEQVNGKDALFTIAPADGSYKVQFGKEEFSEYLQEFLRPALIEMLF